MADLCTCTYSTSRRWLLHTQGNTIVVHLDTLAAPVPAVATHWTHKMPHRCSTRSRAVQKLQLPVQLRIIPWYHDSICSKYSKYDILSQNSFKTPPPSQDSLGFYKLLMILLDSLGLTRTLWDSFGFFGILWYCPIADGLVKYMIQNSTITF